MADRTTEQIIGKDALIQLGFEGYAVVRTIPSTPPATKGVTEAAAAILDILNTEALVFPLDAKAKRLAERLALAALASLSLPAPGEGESFQARVQPWMMACFGPEISGDKVERGDRLLEEVLELLQSGGYDPARVAALRDYVWSRPAGEPAQEVGGVQVTLAAYCLAHALDMHEAGETELARIWTKVEKIRAKQAAKPVGSALPVALSPTAPELGAVKGWRPTHRHVKRGSKYRFDGYAEIQTDAPLTDYAKVVIYSAEDGCVWVRPVGEFADGRFVVIDSAAQNAEPQTDEMQPDMYTGGDFNGVVRGKRP